MTPGDALMELLDRVAAVPDTAALFNAEELARWPDEAVAALQAQKIITKAQPASSTVCPGCEEECVMPVHTLPHPAGPAAFIVCDKRDDINRVAVPITGLEQWQASGSSIADLLADLLGLRRAGAGGTSNGRWEIGMLKGAHHASHLVLLAGDRLTLTVAGHVIALSDVLAFEGDAFKVDKRTVTRLVDQPVAGAGDVESAAQRRKRLKQRVQGVKARGTKAFLKTVAEEEGISVTRLKQLVRE